MKALDSALQVLKLFATAETLSVGEITERLGLQKSNVSKVLAVYRDHGILQQDPVTRRYRVGLAAFELGSAYARNHPVAHEALSIMRELVDRCGHTATLSVKQGDLVLHLMAVEGPLYVDGRWRVGNRLAYHATSAGKVLVAGMSDDEVRELLKRQPPYAITPDTVTDPALLKKQLRKIRETGVAISRGESTQGLAAVAVPVFDASGRTVAALGLIVPDHLYDDALGADMTRLLHEAARRLSVKLGASVYPFGDAHHAVTSVRGAASRRTSPVRARQRGTMREGSRDAG